MLFRQIIHDDLGCASYLIGDEQAGVAAVIDPSWQIEEYLVRARFFGVEIKHIFETHNHADHISGHGRLVAATGAKIHIHRLAEASYDHEPFDDGYDLELGSIRIEALHVPGHRPEHTAFKLFDGSRGEQPWAVLTGDSLFVGEIARPDLAVDRVQGAQAIFHSLHNKLLTLPPETEVWPGHLRGSLCGGSGLSAKVCSTIGYELAHNELLQERDEEAFVQRIIERIPRRPPSVERVVAANQGPLITKGPPIVALSPYEVEKKRSEGAMLVDIRTAAQFDRAHISTAISISALRAGFGTNLSAICDESCEVVLIGWDSADAQLACQLALAAGVTNLAGYLSGGMTNWHADERSTVSLESINTAELLQRVQNGLSVQIVDVRSETEWEAGHIVDSINVHCHDLRKPAANLNFSGPIAVICASGNRAALGASLLKRQGAEQVLRVAKGGVGEWKQLGGPIISGNFSPSLANDDENKLATA